MVTSLEQEIYEQYAMEVPLLWELRGRAVRDPVHDLPSLAFLDERVEANLDGLRLAEGTGWQVAEGTLESAGPGEVFLCTVLAVERGDAPGLARVLALAAEDPQWFRGAISGLAWLAEEDFEAVAPCFIEPLDAAPLSQYLGIAACAGRRRDPGQGLRRALRSEHALVRARALRAVGELGRRDLPGELSLALLDDSPVCRFWAAWSAALLGNAQALTVLWEVALSGRPESSLACATAMRCLDLANAHLWIRSLASRAPRLAVISAGALGEPSLLPWLAEVSRVPELSRCAGHAFSMITGLKGEEERLFLDRTAAPPSGPTEDPEDEDTEFSPEDDLPAPDPEALAHWCRNNPRRFPAHVRFLAGKAISLETLESQLRLGDQTVRAAAAEELLVRKLRRNLFEVRAPGVRQLKELGM